MCKSVCVQRCLCLTAFACLLFLSLFLSLCLFLSLSCNQRYILTRLQHNSLFCETLSCISSFLCSALRPPQLHISIYFSSLSGHPSSSLGKKSKKIPRQFTVGVLNSLLRGARLCPGGGVRLPRCVRIHLSPSLAGGVRLSGSLVSLHLSPTLAGGVRLSGSLSSLVSLHLSPRLAGGVLLSGSLSSLVSLYLFPSQTWCPALRISVFTCLDLFPSRAGGVRLSGSLSSLVSLHLSPGLAGGVRLSGSLS